MQITKIQNTFKNNFQYKNTSIKFGAKYNFNSQEGDIVELSQKLAVNPDEVVVSKKYHRGKQEFDKKDLLQKGQRLFIRRKDTYVPYGAHLEEYNSKGELIRHTSYGNGAKFIVDSYKNGELIQEDRYEDVFGFSPYPTKRTNVRKFDGYNKTSTKRNVTFSISRNYGKDWKKQPTIELEKETPNGVIKVSYIAQSEEKIGEAYVKNLKTSTSASIFMVDDGKYTLIPKNNEDIILLFDGLNELKETIQNEEFRADFGFNAKFNSELDKTIEFLSSKLNDAN